MIEVLLFGLLCIAISGAPIYVSPDRLADCPPLPPHQPKNVLDLSPVNIKVAAAFGDSITAGFGIIGLAGGIEEYRGQSGAIGGDPGAITVANILKNFSPNLFGMSYGQHAVEFPGEGFYPNDVLNAAQSAARTGDLVYQAQHMLSVIVATPNVSLTQDWKLFNVLIGANDACPLCWEFDRPTPAQAGASFEQKVSDAIDFVFHNIPRSFINILPLFPLSQVYNISLGTTYCKDVHIGIPIECPCAFDSNYANRLYLDSVVQEFDNRMIALVNSWKAKNLNEFAITYQPFTQHLQIPSIDYLSTLDCFHPSLLAHQQLAISGWNSIITPWAQKPLTFIPNQQVRCPDANTRFS